MSKNLQHDVINKFANSNDNYLFLECKVGADTYLIGSINGPNKDDPQFFDEIGEILNSVECDHVVLRGDFNFVVDAEKDCFGYTHENNLRARKEFLSICNQKKSYRHLETSEPRTTSIYMVYTKFRERAFEHLTSPFIAMITT